jgi:hypothetical protein
MLADDPDLIGKFKAVRPSFRKFVIYALLQDTNDLVRATTYELLWASPEMRWPSEMFRDGLWDRSVMVRFHAAHVIEQDRRKDCIDAICAAYRRETETSLKTKYVRVLLKLDGTGCLQGLSAFSPWEQLTLHICPLRQRR